MARKNSNGKQYQTYMIDYILTSRNFEILEADVNEMEDPVDQKAVVKMNSDHRAVWGRILYEAEGVGPQNARVSTVG